MPFLVQIAEEGYDVPELDDQPSLDVVLQWYFDAFFQLSHARGTGFSGPQPISMAEIQAYLDMKGITDRERRSRFMRYIKALDRTFLEDHYDEEGE